MLVLLARHLISMAAPPIVGGAVAVTNGRIVAAGRRRDVLEAAQVAPEVRDLGDVALVPGLVNAHTHLELSWLGEDPPAGSGYAGWVTDLLDKRERLDPAAARSAAERAIATIEARGTVAVGDVANDVWIAPILARSSLRAILFHEIYGFRSTDAERLLDEAAVRLDTIEQDPDVRAARGRIQVALTPHAAHTTSHALLRALAGRSAAAQEPLSIHVAESEAETELLQHGTGPLADLLRRRGAWEEGWSAPGRSPVDYLDRAGILGPRTLAVHCVHIGNPDLSRLQSRGVTVVTCPRSNTRLGVGKAPVPKLLAAGIPVAIGTDSLASTPDLDLLAEIAALRAEHPGLAPAAVLRMATINGAGALGLSRDLGTIEPGKLAAFLAVPLQQPEDDPLETVTSNPAEVSTIRC